MKLVSRGRFLLALMLGFAGACSSGGSYVWFKDYPVSRSSAETVTIEPGDELSIQVWKAEQLSGHQLVRDDGRISLFFAADLRVAGLTTSQAADSIAARLDGVLVAPKVNVVIEKAAASTVTVLGEVVHPGQYPARDAPTLTAALGLASGLTDFAHHDRIYVLRRTPEVVRIRFTYDQLMHGEDVARGFHLRPGDTVIVE